MRYMYSAGIYVFLQAKYRKHMKTYSILFFVLIFTACRHNKQTALPETTITVSIEPLRYFAETVAGERFRIVSMVPEGNSPETYDPTPQQLITLSKSRAFLRIGHIGYEQAWVDKLQENARDVPFFDLSEGIALIRETEGEHTHAGGVEPHVWTSVVNAHIIAGNIFRALCQIDPDGTTYYRQRLDTLQTILAQTGREIRTYLQHGEKAFLIYHPALSYFARDYGLTQISIEEGGKEPSPARLRTLIRQCRQIQVGTVFVQKEFDTRNAEVIAAELQVPVVTINPLSYHWNEEMIHIARALAH